MHPYRTALIEPPARAPSWRSYEFSVLGTIFAAGTAIGIVFACFFVMGAHQFSPPACVDKGVNLSRGNSGSCPAGAVASVSYDPITEQTILLCNCKGHHAQ